MSETNDTDRDERTLFVFDSDFASRGWRVINDGVMGGVSRSSFTVTGGRVGVFAGSVSLENNGGFASVRGTPGTLNLGGFDGIRLTVRGDGKRYRLRLKTDAEFDGVVHQASFTTEVDSTLTVDVPFEEFEPVYRGRRMPGEPPLDPGRVQQIGFLISDRQEGPFRLEILRVAAYRTRSTDR